MVGWIILNGIAYSIDLHYHVSSSADRAPSMWWLLLGGGVMNVCISFLSKTK